MLKMWSLKPNFVTRIHNKNIGSPLKKKKKKLKIDVSIVLIQKGSPNEVWGKGVYGVLVFW